jgi:hypothetical protein
MTIVAGGVKTVVVKKLGLVPECSPFGWPGAGSVTGDCCCGAPCPKVAAPRLLAITPAGPQSRRRGQRWIHLGRLAGARKVPIGAPLGRSDA